MYSIDGQVDVAAPAQEELARLPLSPVTSSGQRPSPWPDRAARDSAWSTYRHLDDLTPDTALAQRDEFEEVPFLRFDDAAHDAFLGWRQDLESLLRSTELHPALASHFSKYRKLVPALALISHLADRGVGPVSEGAMLRTVAFVEYLATHATLRRSSALSPPRVSSKPG